MSTQTYNKGHIKMEAPQNELEVFSAILIQEYIRLMTVADCIKHEGESKGAKFAINDENYKKIIQEPLQTALLGLELNYANGVLSVIPSQDLMKQYENKIMKEMALMYWDNYGKRYAKYITIIEENN